MTSKELAAALRQRFMEKHVGFPDLQKSARYATNDRVIEGNLRCGACRQTHTPKTVALELATKHATLQPWLEDMQALALRTWPQRCLLILAGVSAKIAEINEAQRRRN